MRPALKSGLLAVWRDRDTLQFGIDPRRATAITGMTEIAWLISLLDGSRDRAQVIAAAQQRGLAADAAERVLALLAAAGALDDFPAETLRAVPEQLRTRLAAELATVSLARRDCDGGAAVLARRRGSSVRIYGTTRVAPAIADILVAAGVGRVYGPDDSGVADQGRGPDTRRSDLGRSPDDGHAGRGRGPDARRSSPDTRHSDGGCIPGDRHAGRGRGPDARRSSPDTRHSDGGCSPGDRHAGRGRGPDARRSSPDAWPGGPADGVDARLAPPSLAVLTKRQPPEHTDGLVRGRIPHLSVSATEAIGVVGPLVLPGRSVCLRCLDLTRTDYDPAWPLILAQIIARQPDPPACDAALTAAVAAQAAAQALAFLDRSLEPPAAVNGTLELVLPGWQWRRRTWPPHRACICGSHP